MILLGRPVKHAFNENLTGTVVGYGTIVNPWSTNTNGVYIVHLDTPIAPTEPYPMSHSLSVWQSDRTVEIAG